MICNFLVIKEPASEEIELSWKIKFEITMIDLLKGRIIEAIDMFILILDYFETNYDTISTNIPQIMKGMWG